ncbi:MAG: outer membrane protein assembly factor BamA [Betaproteobacteria bacterium]|jgi:outer membrane protein insertion porin family|nr:outer membrane protein assembly factor BamA [Betaproteobacteria bacterium]
MRNGVSSKCRSYWWLRHLCFAGLVAWAAAFSDPVAAQFSQPGAAAAAPALGRPIRDIRIEGLQRIEPGTVFSYLPLQIGDRVTEQGTAEAVRTLFATGFFKDVRIELEGEVLVISVEERPAIGAVEIAGSKEFTKDQLLKSLRDTGLAESRIFDRALLDRAEQELKRQYLGRGKYNVRIVSTITPLERNRVAVQLAIVEGEDARIKQIRILGAKAFKESLLLEEFRLGSPNWASWYTKADQYSRQKLTGDLESLRSFYLNRGYLEFAVDSTQVSLSPDRRDVFITIVINEGEKYTLKDVRLVGDTLGRESEFAKFITVKPGEIFSNQRLQAITKAISDRLGELGYAFASVTPVPQIDRESRTVNFALQIDSGRRVYVRNINISGNTRTRDEVIRREMRQLEASWYDGDRLRLSRNRIDRLGYFRQVEIDTVPVVGTQDQVDVGVRVEERPLGTISLGVGVSSTENFIINASIFQQNFLGTGTNLSLEVNNSQLRQTLVVNHVDPYWTDDGVSRSIDVYSRRFFPIQFDAQNLYNITSQGAGIRFGIPYTEEDRIFFGVGAENNRYGGSESAWPAEIVREVRERFKRENLDAYFATLGWVRDSRDSAIAPTRGRRQHVNFEYATPLGMLEYIRFEYGHQVYYPMSRTVTLAFNGEIGRGEGLGGKTFPILKNYYVGGIGSVRSFAPGGIGPRSSNGGALGGNQRLLLNSELLFPLPGMTQDRTIRVFAYFDVGSVWQEAQTPGFDDLRAATGVGLSWLSPIGPLKLSMGRTLRKQPGDRTQGLQFQIGTGF